MNKKTTLFTLTALIAVLLLTTSFVSAEDNTFGSAGASADDRYTLEEMLVYAIQDEFMAQAEYEAIMDNYGVRRPFSNIIRSEGTHINLLLPLFGSYGYPVPENSASKFTVLPDSLAQAYEIGVEAEMKNIDMYEKFLKQDLPADVRLVFERLMNASENHLKAFENAGNNAKKGFGAGMNREFRNGYCGGCSF